MIEIIVIGCLLGLLVTLASVTLWVYWWIHD